VLVLVGVGCVVGVGVELGGKKWAGKEWPI